MRIFSLFFVFYSDESKVIEITFKYRLLVLKFTNRYGFCLVGAGGVWMVGCGFDTLLSFSLWGGGRLIEVLVFLY